jgi:hypothetical protein
MIGCQFAPRTIEMLRSPAMRALSLTGRRILDCVEIELASHGGKDNGQLPVTHTDLVEFGIHDHAIGPGLREVEALGFVEIKRGRAGNAEFRRPNLFRLTYRPTEDKHETNEWRQIAAGLLSSSRFDDAPSRTRCRLGLTCAESPQFVVAQFFEREF